MISLKKFRQAAVPLLAVQTADPAEIVRTAVKEASNGTTSPVLRWDCMHGLCPLNAPAEGLADALNGQDPPEIVTGNPTEFLRALEKTEELPKAKNSIVLALGMADIIADPSAGIPVRQALWNLRDILSVQRVLLVLTVPLGWRNPFPDDIAVLVAPLPSRDEQVEMAVALCDGSGYPVPAEDDRKHIGDALLGLSAFAAEQAVALSLTKQGIDKESLRARKRQQIGETRSLTVYEGKETLKSIAGVRQAKTYIMGLVRSKKAYGAIAWMDEFEKSIAANKTDSSGVTQDQTQQFLSYMDNPDVDGLLLVGVPGGGKSAIVKCVGNEAGIPTIQVDIGAMKAGIVGESEQAVRTAFSVLTAISGGRLLVIATCNSIDVLTPEMRRRFNLGIMYFDYPDREEQEAILNLYLEKFNLDKEQDMPDMTDWTGAEIRQCCDLADTLGLSMVEASKYVVPVCVSAAEQMTALRRLASGKFLSASYEGVYQFSGRTKTTTPRRNVSAN